MGSGPFLIHTLTNNIIPFNGASVFTIGRSGDCNLDIAAIYISRKQCRIENLRNVGWVLFDESRFKTTKLNNETVSSNYVALKDGDKISFSPNSCSHEYTFHCEGDEVQRKKRKLDDSTTEVKEEMKLSSVDNTVENDRLSPLDLLREMATQSSYSLLSPKKGRADEFEKIKKENIMLELQLKRSREHLEANEISVYQLEAENKNLLSRLEEMEKNKNELLENLNTLQSNFEADLSSKKASLDKQLLELKSACDKVSQENLDLKDIVTDAENEIENLLKERCCKIIKFGAESNNKDSADTLTEVELSLMKEDLKELTNKNSELSLNLEIVTTEKEEFSSKFNDIIDSELYCSICSDLLYQAITLQCKHTFCKSCIEEWKKKKRDCPVCRTKIRTQVPCLIIDNLIDKVADAVGGDMKSRRQELIKERTEAAAAATPRTNKRKRNSGVPNIPLFPALDPIMEHLVIAPNLIDNYFGGHHAPFPEIINLTNSSPPHPPFRGFERHGRRRRR